MTSLFAPSPIVEIHPASVKDTEMSNNEIHGVRYPKRKRPEVKYSDDFSDSEDNWLSEDEDYSSQPQKKIKATPKKLPKHRRSQLRRPQQPCRQGNDAPLAVSWQMQRKGLLLSPRHLGIIACFTQSVCMQYG